MNHKIVLLGIILSFGLVPIVSPTELVFEEIACIINQDCTLHDLFLTGNFSFIGAITNVTIINQNVTGQLAISGGLEVDGNVSATNFIGDGSLLTGIATSTSVWNSTGSNVYLNDSTGSLGIGVRPSDMLLDVDGNANISNNLYVGTGSSGQILASSSSGGVPAYSFRSQTRNGFAIASSTQIDFIIDGNPEGSFKVNAGVGSFATKGTGFATNVNFRDIDDINTGMYFPTLDTVAFSAGGINFLDLVEGGTDIIIFNDNKNNIDFRVETDNEENMLFIDGGNDKIGIGTNTPSQELVIIGSVNITADLISPTIYDVSSQGLVLAMNFNNNSINGNVVLDSSGFNNHGTNNGATHNSTGGFNSGGAYQFNGNDFININSAQTALASTTQGTWTAWVKPINATPLTSEEFIAFGDINANEFIHITIFPSGKFNAFARSAAGLKFSLQTDSAVFSDNTWTQVVLVQNGVSPVIYIDGVAVAQTFITSTDKTYWFNDSTGIDNGRIGDINRNNDGETLHFNGSIDEVRIYDKASSSEEIKRLYLQRSEFHDSYVSQRDIYIDSSSRVGINTTSPAQTLTVQGTLNVTADTTAGPNLFVASDGNVGIGTSSPVAPLEIQSLAASMRQTRYSDTGVQSAGLTVQRSRGTTIGTDVIVQDGDRIANFNLRGYDGALYRTAASIQAFIDGTPGGGDMPGRLTFLTTADGSSSPTERLRIDSLGNVGLGLTNPNDRLEVIGNVRISGTLNASRINTTILHVEEDALIEGKLDIGVPGAAGGLDIGEGGSYIRNHTGTIIVQAFTYDASAASGSRFTEFTDLDASNTLLADVGDRLYIGSDELFWATRFEISTAMGDSHIQMKYYDGSRAVPNLTNMTHMGILKDSATTVGERIWNQTAEKEYVTWDHAIERTWIRGDNVVDLLPDADGNKFWVVFEIPPAGITNAPVVTEIRVRGTDVDFVTGLAFQVYWGDGRIGVHERIPLTIAKTQGGTGTTNINIDSAHSQTVFNFNGAGDEISWFWVLPECIDTSSEVDIKLEYAANAVDTFDFTTTISELRNGTPIGSGISPDFQFTSSIPVAAANTIYVEHDITPEKFSIENMSASDIISTEFERDDAGNAFYPLSVTYHYLKWCNGNLATLED